MRGGGYQMGRKPKKANNPVSKNLDRILRSGKGLKENLKMIEEKTGIAQSSIRNWISGNRKAQLANLEKIANLFNFDVWILYQVDPQKLSPAHIEAIKLIQGVTNHNILEAIKIMAKAGSLPNDKNKTPPDSEKS